MRSLVAKIMLFGLCPMAIALGSWVVSDYAYRPGESGSAATNLNSVETFSELLADDIVGNPRAATIIVFYHPHCPCTNSTIRNLERVSTRFSKKTRIVAFGFCPSEKPESWISSPITTSLKHLDAKVIADTDGRYCTEFGIRTSGHVLVYSDRGELMFSGGITPGRGHEGDCSATEEFLNKSNGHVNNSIHWPVYGCPIIASEEQP